MSIHLYIQAVLRVASALQCKFGAHDVYLGQYDMEFLLQKVSEK